jgi:hypothetical protein
MVRRRSWALLLLALLAACDGGSGDGSSTISIVTSVPPSATDPMATAPGSPPSTSADSAAHCPLTDIASGEGGCVIGDWDAVSVDGARLELEYHANDPGCAPALQEVVADERPDAVVLTVLLRYTGGPGVGCATGYATRTTTVELAEPLGDRHLLRCRNDRSFVPEGGFGTGTRSPAADCRRG